MFRQKVCKYEILVLNFVFYRYRNLDEYLMFVWQKM